MMNISIDDTYPNVAILLVDFFNFFNNLSFTNIEINPLLDVIEIQQQLPVIIYQKFVPNQNYTFIVRDPLNKEINLVESFYFHVENLFYFIYFSFFQIRNFQINSILENVFETAKNYYSIKI